MIVRMGIDLDTDDFLESIEQLSHDEVFDIIKDIDGRMADWDFTNRLYEYFRELHGQYIEEEEEDDLIENIIDEDDDIDGEVLNM